MSIRRANYVLAMLFCASCAAAAEKPLTADSFGAITDADFRKLNMSGCSFAVFRGKRNIVWFETGKKQELAIFKIDGKLLLVPGGAGKDKTARWTGTVASSTLRLIKGKVDPNVKLDEGSGGFGRIEWTGPAGRGAMDTTWQEGC